jgi:hypothetical protein
MDQNHRYVDHVEASPATYASVHIRTGGSLRADAGQTPTPRGRAPLEELRDRRALSWGNYVIATSEELASRTSEDLSKVLSPFSARRCSVSAAGRGCGPGPIGPSGAPLRSREDGFHTARPSSLKPSNKLHNTMIGITRPATSRPESPHNNGHSTSPRIHQLEQRLGWSVGLASSPGAAASVIYLVLWHSSIEDDLTEVT